MIADIGTRKGVKIKDINQDSIWRNGFEWMKLDQSQFPVKSVIDIKLDNDQVTEMKKEFISNYDSDNLVEIQLPNQNLSNNNTTNQIVKESIYPEVLEIYEFSDYIIDPNRHRFKTVIRILAIVYKFIDALKERIYSKSVNSKPTKVIDNNSTSKSIILSEDEIQRSQNYFYKLATMEVKKFANLSQYDIISKRGHSLLYRSNFIYSRS